ncbi:hypothetical protein ACVWZA_004377 [Sphingomonas sp. UYAg733]
MLGPYPVPGLRLSPNVREAPAIVRAPNGEDWLLYYEQCAGSSYGLPMVPKLAGPGYQVSGNSGVPEWNRHEMPVGTRHGSTIGISRKQCDAIVAAFQPRQ